MIHKISVIPETITSEILFFTEVDLNGFPDKRIIPLFGANGSGKTTLLEQIETALRWKAAEKEIEKAGEDELLQALTRSELGLRKKSEVVLDMDDCATAFYKYRNTTDNFKNFNSGFNPALISARFDAQALSEGQSIVYSVEDLLRGMLKSTPKHESFIEDDIHCVLLLDEIDSGMSLDNIGRMLRIIKRVLNEKRNIQFFISFNNPYFVYFFPYVLSMYDGKMYKLSNFDEMLSEIRANQKTLDKARKNSRGKYKIFE